MAGSVKILVDDNDYIDYLGQFGPIAAPMKVPFKTALYVANEGHDVKIVTSANQQVSLDTNRIKKMIARDEKIENMWNEILEEKEEEAEVNQESNDVEPPASDLEEEPKDEETTTYESSSDIEDDESLSDEEKEEFQKLLEEEEGDGPVIRG